MSLPRVKKELLGLLTDDFAHGAVAHAHDAYAAASGGGEAALSVEGGDRSGLDSIFLVDADRVGEDISHGDRRSLIFNIGLAKLLQRCGGVGDDALAVGGRKSF